MRATMIKMTTMAKTMEMTRKVTTAIMMVAVKEEMIRVMTSKMKNLLHRRRAKRPQHPRSRMPRNPRESKLPSLQPRNPRRQRRQRKKNQKLTRKMNQSLMRFKRS